jgi:hypothetical protein
MDLQDKIYLWLALATTSGFTIALIFAIMKLMQYKEAV